jgi:glycosyltransferase involved in cell wall biosynthesis
MLSLSVIIPTYNRADLVDRCLRSLYACGLPDLEVIVVDDGGTDDTPAVARRHGATYLRQANAGPAAARNTGFAASRGELVAFIDSDDEWINGGARRLCDALKANPDVQVVFADSSMGNADDGFESFVGVYGGAAFAALPHRERPDGLRVLERRPFFTLLSTRNVMFLGSLVLRRAAFEALEGFDRNLRGAADWDLFMRSVAAGPVGFSTGPAVSRYYKHEAGMSTDADHMAEEFILALESVRRRSRLDDLERAHVTARLREHIFAWAWVAYDRGNLAASRQRLGFSRRFGVFHLREAAYLAATFLPVGVLRVLRRVRFVSSFLLPSP